jgi:hypothetical protein
MLVFLAAWNDFCPETTIYARDGLKETSLSQD